MRYAIGFRNLTEEQQLCDGIRYDMEEWLYDNK